MLNITGTYNITRWSYNICLTYPIIYDKLTCSGDHLVLEYQALASPLEDRDAMLAARLAEASHRVQMEPMKIIAQW